MRRSFLKGSFVAVALVLTACDRPEDDRICQTPVAENVAQEWLKDIDTADPVDREFARRRYLDNCMLKWAYRLAQSPDSAEIAAQAVIGACAGAVNHLNSTAAAAKRADFAERYPGIPPEWSSPRDGRDVTVQAYHYEVYPQKALFHVVQARAGHCDVPS